MTEVSFNKKSAEKYDLLLNGIRNSVNLFLDDLRDDKVKTEELDIFIQGEDTTIYSKKCESMYIIFGKSESGWYILDILTPEEYKEIHK